MMKKPNDFRYIVEDVTRIRHRLAQFKLTETAEDVAEERILRRIKQWCHHILFICKCDLKGMGLCLRNH